MICQFCGAAIEQDSHCCPECCKPLPPPSGSKAEQDDEEPSFASHRILRFSVGLVFAFVMAFMGLTVYALYAIRDYDAPSLVEIPHLVRDAQLNGAGDIGKAL